MAAIFRRPVYRANIRRRLRMSMSFLVSFVRFNLHYCTEVTDEIIKQKVAEMLEKHGLKYRID